MNASIGKCRALKLMVDISRGKSGLAALMEHASYTGYSLFLCPDEAFMLLKSSGDKDSNRFGFSELGYMTRGTMNMTEQLLANSRGRSCQELKVAMSVQYRCDPRFALQFPNL